MFRFANQSRVFWPVELASRGADGEPVTATAYIGYRILTDDELDARNDESLRLFRSTDIDIRIADGNALKKANKALLRERVFGWRDVVDNDDKLLPFSAEMLDAMLADPLLFKALLHGLFEASRGAKEKNSLPGPGGTPALAQRTTDAGSGMPKADGATSPANTAPAPASA